MTRTNPNSSIARLTALAAGVLALSGCVSVLPEVKAPRALIELPSSEAKAPDAPLRADVAIYTPDVGRAYAGADIAVRSGPEIVYLSDERWADAAPRLLQSAVINALVKAGGDGRAVTAEQSLRTDYDLRWRISDLSVSPGGGDVKVEAEASLALSGSRRIVAQRHIEATRTPASGRSRDRAAALATASQDAADQIAAFVAESAEPIADPVAEEPEGAEAGTAVN